MTYKKFILLFFILTAASFCFAQSDSISFSDNINKNRLLSQNIFSPQPLPLNIYTPDNYLLNKVYLNPGHADLFFKKPITYDNFGRRYFYYKYDTLNPWGASTPLDAFVGGVVNYLIQSVDKKFFYKK